MFEEVKLIEEVNNKLLAQNHTLLDDV